MKNSKEILTGEGRPTEWETIRNSLCCWDYTAPFKGDIDFFCEDSQIEIQKKLKEICKKWAYQIEEGESGYIHYQVRISLKVKERVGSAYESLSEIFGAGHITPTTSENRKEDFYVIKNDTRRRGPWTNETEAVKIPWDVSEFNIGETKWMEETIKWMENKRNLRKILVWVDNEGSNGKSSFKRWAYFNKELDVMTVPMLNDYSDICEFVMCQEKRRNYIIDMPRAMNKDKLYQFWCGMESLKEGYAYDKRYHGKQEYFDPPNIIIFTNTLPDMSMLSKDRWEIRKIEKIIKKEEKERDELEKINK